MSAIRQPSFLGGELDPLLWGRTDLDLFNEGLRGCRNFFVHPGGSAMSRPGTTYIGQAKAQNAEPNVRLVPFVFSATLAYAIELSQANNQLVLRFLTDNAFVQATYLDYDALGVGFSTGPTTDLFGSTSLTHARIITNLLQTGVSGRLQIEIISGPGFVDNETITNASGPGSATANGVSRLADLELRQLGVPVPATPPPFVGELSKLKWAQAGAVLFLVHPNLPPMELTRISATEWTLLPTAFATARPYFAGDRSPTVKTPLPTVDATHPEREWELYVTLSVRNVVTGRRFETQAWKITSQWDGNIVNPATALAVPQKFAIYPDRPLTIQTQAHIPVDPLNTANTSYTVDAVNYYRGQGLERGWVGSTTLFGEFIDLGDKPDYQFPPPRGTNPFSSNQNPFAIAFFQERLAYAASALQPNALWLSETGDYRNFDLPLVRHHAGESLLFEFAAQKYEETRHLFSDLKLLAFTSSTVRTISGDDGNALDYDHIDGRLEGNDGASHVPPVKVGKSILYARARVGVRALRFTGSNYEGADVSTHSQHLFLGAALVSGAAYGKAIVDWAYAEDPFGLVWACRDDGVLLSLTHVGDRFAWARHDCDGARFLRVCAIPEGKEDAVYMVVQRKLNGALVNCIERQASRVRYGTPYDDCAVDCALLATVDPTNPATWRIQLPHLVGETVWVTGISNNPESYVVGVDAASGYLIPGITLRQAPTAQNTGSGGIIAPGPPGVGSAAALYVGLRFTPELETLDAISSESRQKRRIVRRVGVELDQSTGIYFGASFDELRSSKPNTVAVGYLAPSKANALVSFDVTDKWSDSGKACVRQTLPLPVTVVGITRDIAFGD